MHTAASVEVKGACRSREGAGQGVRLSRFGNQNDELSDTPGKFGLRFTYLTQQDWTPRPRLLTNISLLFQVSSPCLRTIIWHSPSRIPEEQILRWFTQALIRFWLANRFSKDGSLLAEATLAVKFIHDKHILHRAAPCRAQQSASL